MSDGLSSTQSVPLPTVEEVKGWGTKRLNEFLKANLKNYENHIDAITVNQEVDGKAFLKLSHEELINAGIPLESTKKIERLIKQIQGGIESLTAGIAQIQLQDKEIWVRYSRTDAVCFGQKELEKKNVRYIHDLRRLIKDQLQSSLKYFSEEVIRLRKGKDILKNSTLVVDLFNTEDEALEIIIIDDGSSLSQEKREERAFQIEYQGTTLETFYTRLNQFYDEWCMQKKPYAPYLTIIQSSGSGKTRLVGELRTKEIYVLYICKRHENNSGYPASTPYVQKILATIRDNRFRALLSAAIKEIKNKSWSAEEFWNIQIKNDYKAECKDFWQSVFESLSQQKKLSSDCSNKNFVKKLFPDTKIPVVCCIDEAHELLTNFVQWRQQIRGISWYGFFNILISTNRKIDILPPVTKDPTSARSYDFVIFPAYLDVNTMDVMASFAENANKDYNPERMAYLGIPLWGSLAQAGVSLIDIIHLASKKIRNFGKNDNDYLANLACMACSLALEVSPRMAEVDSLIASHMATAIGISLDRTSILCTYPSDTILASGALKGIINIGWKNCLDTLLELFSRGVIEVEERGELVNRILFLKAYAYAVNECEKPLTYLQKVPLKSFLKSLLYKEIHGLDKFLENMGIDEAEIGFNHWTALLATNIDHVNSGGNKFLTEDLVIEAYHRHTAFKMPLGFHVIDHIIPFRYNGGYGIISIQNKSAKEKTFDDEDIFSLISPSNAFGELKKDYKVLGIYIDLDLDSEKLVEAKAELKGRNVSQTRSTTKNEKDDDQITKKESDQIIYIQNIKTFKCDDEINESLSKILYTRPWPLDAQWSMFNERTGLKREDAIKSFLPLVFEQKQSLADTWQL